MHKGKFIPPVLPAQKANGDWWTLFYPSVQNLLSALLCMGDRNTPFNLHTRTLRLRNGAPVCKVKATKRSSSYSRRLSQPRTGESLICPNARVYYLLR